MRYRYPIVVATIAASVMSACRDAAVDQVTAPPSAATPLPSLFSTWPTTEEVEAAAIPSAIGVQIVINAYFTPDSLTFVVEGHVSFQWANDVSATIWASVINKNGTVINSSEASMGYQRFGLPVSRGDTTFVVRVSTNGIKCGLTGKSAFAGRAATKDVDARFVVLTLWEQNIGRTNGPDVSQAACPTGGDGCQVASRVSRDASASLFEPPPPDCDAPAPPPNGGGSEPVEACYVVWREYWYYDLLQKQYSFRYQIPIGMYCYVPAT